MRIEGRLAGEVVSLNWDVTELRRDNLALHAPEPSEYDINSFHQKEIIKARAKDTYIKQEFDYEKFRYDWADKMITASEKGDSK